MNKTAETQLLERINHSTLFLQHNNLTITHVEDGCAEIELEVDPKVLNPYGIVHGGILFSMADTVAGAACLASGSDCVTLNSSINFIKPGKGKKIYGKAKEISSGKTINVYEVNITNEKGSLIAQASITMFRLNSKHREHITEPTVTDR